MGVTNSNKRINADRIECDGSLKVTLALTAAPDIVSNPTDIVLVLDRSGSMAGEPLAAILTEVDPDGMEYQRGMKTMTIPAHRYEGCRDIQVKCIRFVVPEDISENGEPAHAMCAPGKFKARFIAHAIDTDYRCCEAVIDL